MSGIGYLAADLILVVLLGMTLGGGIALVLMTVNAFRGRKP